MKADILKELKIVVERAVRPIRATLARKRKMREELLAHLASRFEEEVERAGDEQAALVQAKRRFGEPQELSKQLQQAVPRWDRWRSILENMGCQPGESAWHLAAKHFWVMLTIYALGFLAALPITSTIGRRYDLRSVPGYHDLGTVLVTAIALALFNTALSLVLAVLLHKIGPGLTAKRRGRFFLFVLCGLVFPFALSGAFSGAAVVFILMVRQATERRHYEEGWA